MVVREQFLADDAKVETAMQQRIEAMAERLAAQRKIADA